MDSSYACINSPICLLRWRSLTPRAQAMPPSTTDREENLGNGASTFVCTAIKPAMGLPSCNRKNVWGTYLGDAARQSMNSRVWKILDEGLSSTHWSHTSWGIERTTSIGMQLG